MAGTITFDPVTGPIALARPAVRVGVFRLSGTPGLYTYELLPHIRVVEIHYEEGAHPGAAQFRYVFDDVTLGPPYPQRFEDCFPVNGVTNPLAVTNDTRIVVRAYADDGSYKTMFDGFAGMPQVDYGPSGEVVTFQAMGRQIRQWDNPLSGAVYRNADNPSAGIDHPTSAPIRFNPDGGGNCTADGSDSVDGTGRNHPVFLDAAIVEATRNNSPLGRLWTLDGAARYLIYKGVRTVTAFDYSSYLDPPNHLDIKAILVSAEPVGNTIDVNDPGGFTPQPIEIGEYDATNHPWPESLARLLLAYGFGMRFKLDDDANGDPSWSLTIYRKDDTPASKPLLLQPAGSTLDPAQTNVGGLRVVRDTAGIFNAVSLDTRETRYEASFILAPGFTIATTDATIANRAAFRKGNTNNSSGTNSIKYRRFIFDECAEGHWNLSNADTEFSIGDLSPILGQGYSIRRRKPRQELISKDSNGVVKRAELWIGTNYGPSYPALWDRTNPATFVKVSRGGWRLLDDRIGIELTCDDPNEWEVCDGLDGGSTLPGGAARMVERLASTKKSDWYYLMLTCVIEGDAGLDATANRRSASPTVFSMSKRFDTKDRYAKEVITGYSKLNGTNNDKAMRDDTSIATDYAEALRRSGELGKYSGSVVIPRITFDFDIGDKVKVIKGRSVDMTMNGTSDSGEGPVYPAIVGVSWSFEGQQRTTLTLGSPAFAPRV